MKLRIHPFWDDVFGDEYWGLSGFRCKPGHFVLMVRYVYRFETVEALLKEICRYYNTTREDVGFSIHIQAEEVVFRTTLRNPELDEDHFLLEFLMVAMHRFICWVTGKRIV